MRLNEKKLVGSCKLLPRDLDKSIIGTFETLPMIFPRLLLQSLQIREE